MCPAVIWCPCADEKEARRLVTQLLDEQLIACGNIVPGLISIFEWQGERGEAQEVGMLLKTNAALMEDAIARLAELHSYDTPSIVGSTMPASTDATRAWLAGLTKTEAAQ